MSVGIWLLSKYVILVYLFVLLSFSIRLWCCHIFIDLIDSGASSPEILLGTSIATLSAWQTVSTLRLIVRSLIAVVALVEILSSTVLLLLLLSQ